MKAEDVVKALVAKLPNLTDKFCDTASIDSITSTGLLATATIAAGHGRVDGELVTITGAVSPITISSITRSTTSLTIVTATKHDFSISGREISRGFTQDVILSGSTEPEFNGTFKLLSVANRKTFTVTVADSGPTTGTGSPVLENGESALAGYNGSFNVTVIDSNVFTYPLRDSIPNAATGAPILNSGHRITATVSMQRFMDGYTKQSKDALYCVVVLGDVSASKGRQTATDAIDQFTDNQHYQQTVSQPFGVYLVVPAPTSIAGRTQRDEMEDVVPFILQALLLEQFPTGFAADKHNRAIFTGHGLFLYNGPLYIHEVTFEQNAEILYVDSTGAGDHVAFRDFDLTLNTDLGTTPLTATVDIDEAPLP